MKINLQLFAEQAGHVNEVWVLTGTTAMTGSTGAKVLGVDNSTYGKLCDMLDIPQFGDTYKKRMPGLKDTTVSISGNVYTGDTTGQDVLEPGDYIFIGLYPQGTATAGKQVAALVANFDTTIDVTGKQTFSAGFSCIAAPVELPARS